MPQGTPHPTATCTLPGLYAGHSHPPVVVQSVYVGRKEDDDDTEKDGDKKGRSKKNKGKRVDPEEEEDPKDSENSSPNRRQGSPSQGNGQNPIRRRNRAQRRRMVGLYGDPYYDPSYYYDPWIPEESFNGREDSCGCSSPMRIVYID